MDDERASFMIDDATYLLLVSNKHAIRACKHQLDFKHVVGNRFREFSHDQSVSNHKLAEKSQYVPPIVTNSRPCRFFPAWNRREMSLRACPATLMHGMVV